MEGFGKADCYSLRMWYDITIQKPLAFGVKPVGEKETFRGRDFAYTCPPVAGILRVLEPPDLAAYQLQLTTYFDIVL